MPTKVLNTLGRACFMVFEIKEYSGEYSRYWTSEIQLKKQPNPQSISANCKVVLVVKMKKRDPKN